METTQESVVSMNATLEMREQVALVTGGGGGIGSAICRRLAAAGAKVVVNYNRNAEKAQATLDSLAGEGHMMAQASVTDSVALAELTTQVTE